MTEWAPDTTPREPAWSPTAQRTFILRGRLLGEVQHTDEGSEGFVAHLRVHAPCLLDDNGVRHPLPTSSDAELFTAAVCGGGGPNGARLAFVMELSAEPAFTAQVTRRVSDFRWLHAALCDMCACGGVAGGALGGVAVPPLPPVLDALAIDRLQDLKGTSLLAKNESRNWLSSAVSSGLSNVQSAQRDWERSAATALSMGAGVLGIGKGAMADGGAGPAEGHGDGTGGSDDAVAMCAAAAGALARAGSSALAPPAPAPAATAAAARRAHEAAPRFSSATAAAVAACAAAARGSALAAALRAERCQQEHAGTAADGEFEVVVGTSLPLREGGAGFAVSGDELDALGAKARHSGVGGGANEAGNRNRTDSGGGDFGALADGGATPGSIADELEQGLNAIVDASARALAAVGGGGSSGDDDESDEDEIGGPHGPTIDVLGGGGGIDGVGDGDVFPGAGAALVRHIACELAHTVGQWLSHPELSRACEHFGMFFEERNTSEWLAYMSSNMGAVTQHLKRLVEASADNLRARAQPTAHASAAMNGDDAEDGLTQSNTDCVHEAGSRKNQVKNDVGAGTQPAPAHDASDDTSAVEWWGGCTVERARTARAHSGMDQDLSQFVREDRAVVVLGWRLAAEYRSLALLQRGLARLCAGETGAANCVHPDDGSDSGMLGVSRAWRAVGAGCAPLATMETLAAASVDVAAQSAATKAATAAADASAVQEAVTQAVRTALPELSAHDKVQEAGTSAGVGTRADPSASSSLTMLQALANAQGRSCALGGRFDKLAARVDSALAEVASLLTAVGERQACRATLQRARSQEVDADQGKSATLALATRALHTAHKNLLSSVRAYDRVASDKLHSNVREFVAAAQAVVLSRRAALRAALTTIQRAENDARALPKREAGRVLRGGKVSPAKASAPGRTVRPVLVVAPPGTPTHSTATASPSVTGTAAATTVTAAVAPPVPAEKAATNCSSAFGTGFGSAYLYGATATALREFEVQFHAGAIGLSFRSIGAKFVVREARAQAAEALVASGDHIVGVNGVALPELRKQLVIGARGGQRALAEHIRALDRPFVVMFEGKRSDDDWSVLQQCLARRAKTATTNTRMND